MKDFNKIVKKMCKKWWKIMFKTDIFELIDPELQEKNINFVDKLIYKLRSEWYIIPLKAWVYVIPEEDDTDMNEIDLAEKYYFKLLKKYITENVGAQYYISGVKSLEFHMRDFSVPEKIFVINRSLNKKILLGEKEIIFKTLTGQDREKKKYNLYTKFSSFVKKISVDGVELKHSWLELALLESSVISHSESGLDTALLTKVIKKYKKVFDYEVFKHVGKYKYNMSFNRLKELSRNLDTNLYKCFLDVIKQNWACFVWEGLRVVV